MRLVESSDPTAVPRWEAERLIHERLILTRAVVAELDASDGQFASALPTAALDLLRGWIGQRYPADVETHVWDGLDEMTVPSGSEPLTDELRGLTSICGDLAMLWTADTRSEHESDNAKIAAELKDWREWRASRSGNQVS